MTKLILKILNIVAIILLIGLLFWWLKTRGDSKLCKNCNVIVFSLDVLSAKHLSCYGYGKKLAPNLCTLAENNIIFNNSYTVAEWTLPSNFSLITGVRPKTHGIRDAYEKPLSPKIKTMAQIFKENGYFTIYSGPADNIHMPFSRGAVRGYDVINTENYNPDTLPDQVYSSLKKSNDATQPVFLYFYTDHLHHPYNPINTNIFKAESVKFPNIPITQEQFENIDTKLIDYVTADLKQRFESSESPDSKTYVKDLLNKILKDGEKGFEKFPNMEKYSYYDMRYQKLFDTSNKEEMNYLASLYDEKIKELDKQIGEIMQMINTDDKFKNNTIIVFTSEHGESFGEHGTVMHCALGKPCLYNEVLKTPLIVVTPNKISKKIDGNVQIIDVLPTLMGLVKIKSSYIFEGIDLTKYITKNISISNTRKIYAEQSFLGQDSGRVLIEGVKKIYIKLKDEKEIARTEYYNLKNDPDEKKDLYNQKTEVEIKDQITDLMQNQNKPRTEFDFPLWLDNSKKEKLLKDGYF